MNTRDVKTLVILVVHGIVVFLIRVVGKRVCLDFMDHPPRRRRRHRLSPFHSVSFVP